MNDHTPSLLEQVARLADQGRLAEAARIGGAALRDGDVGADLLALLATTYDALHDVARAEQCYRRALYLDPLHQSALLHFALLLDRTGDPASAARLRARARRAFGGQPQGTS